MKTKEQDHQIMSILNVNEISRVICDTNMGTLKLRIRKGETLYKFVLDAVELPKDLNNELMEAIYPKIIGSGTITLSPEKSIVTLVNADKEFSIVDGASNVPENIIKVITKPRGRPKGSKNINKLTK